jgi:1-acyl-sn-glycerol-3-phosphate acyltransferase
VVVKRSSLVYSITKRTAQMVFSIFYHLEIERRGTLPDRGPAIILPKHQYWTDIPVVGLSFGPLLYFVAKTELFKYPVVRQYISLAGGIPVDRKQSIRTLDSFKNLLSLLRAGERIVIFPEGTYFREIVGSGKSRLLQMILRFQKELNCRIPFIPVGIRYGKRMRWRRQVEICIGHPLYAEKESDATSLTHEVMEEISCLCRMPRCST